MKLQSRKPYTGIKPRLLLAFDIGTTYSGVSYSILDPGKVPEIHPVTSYPGLETTGGNSKIPTILYYDSKGKMMKAGAEAHNATRDAKMKRWKLARWFKLHLRPRDAPDFMSPGIEGEAMPPPMPAGKSVIDLFADYMVYLNDAARTYIKRTHGDTIVESMGSDTLFIFTHPNGWGGPQQADMRHAAVKGGLVPDTDEGRARVSFVTEGEASLHFCLTHGLSIPGTRDPSGIMIVDAGGGTIDITAYRKKEGVAFEEIEIPQCHLQGAAYVTNRARGWVGETLKGTIYKGYIDRIVNAFDAKGKHVFDGDDNEPWYCELDDSLPDNDNLGILDGFLAIPCEKIAAFFEPSISCIVDAITGMSMSTRSTYPIKSVFLVGGFSGNGWMFKEIEKRIKPLGIALLRPDTGVNKAVADGAVSFNLDHVVDSRVARSTFGVDCNTSYDDSITAHRARSSKVKNHSLHGGKILSDLFDVILPKKTKVSETTEFTRSYFRCSSSSTGFGIVEDVIWSYNGSKDGIMFMDEEKYLYKQVCTVTADTSRVLPQRCVSQKGVYYRIDYDIVLLFGLTELKAQLVWKEGDREVRGPAHVVFERD